MATPEELPGIAEKEGTTPETTPPAKQRSKLARVLITVGMMLMGPLMLSVLIGSAMAFAIDTAGNNQQSEIEQAHDTALLYLGNCKFQMAEAAQLDRFDPAVNDMLTRVVTGDYGKAAELQTDKIVEALHIGPKVDVTKAMLTLAVCQDQFLQKQQTRDNAVVNFKRWRTQDWFTTHMGGPDFPNDDLRVSVGERCAHGAEALDALSLPIKDFTINTQWEEKDPERKACAKQ